MHSLSLGRNSAVTSISSDQAPGERCYRDFGPRREFFVYCFWHSHSGDAGQRKPATNGAFWERKRGANVHRDRRNIEALKKQGWDVMVIWECELNEGYEFQIDRH